MNVFEKILHTAAVEPTKERILLLKLIVHRGKKPFSAHDLNAGAAALHKSLDQQLLDVTLRLFAEKGLIQAHTIARDVSDPGQGIIYISTH